MKIALVHDQLQEFGGAERVLIALKQIFPEADIYTSFYNPTTFGVHAKKFDGWEIQTSWAQKIPLLDKLYSPIRFITPLIWESFDFSGYDLVISSSGSYMSKGIITRPETTHICYIHHQPRYLYGYETGSLHELKKYLPFRVYAHLVNHKLRLWDYLSSQRVDHFIANSEETKKRVWKFYRRDSTVVYPSVSIPKKYSFNHQRSPASYYLTVSRLARPKHIEVLIKAANKMQFELKIVGTGRDKSYLKSLAGNTIEFLGTVSDTLFPTIYEKAKAFLFAGVDEEFGIAPIEAMGYGLPVIAYASGGLKETVKDSETGFLFTRLHEDSLIDKVKQLEALPKSKYGEMRKKARHEAEKYSFENFKKHILEFVHSKLTS